MRQPGHAVGLGHAVDGQDAVAKVGRDRRQHDVLGAVEDEMFVDFVGHHGDVREFAHDVGESHHLGLRVHGAAGISGAVEKKPFGPRRDRGAQLGGGEFEPFLDGAGHENTLAADEIDHVAVADPARRRDDDFVALVDGSHKGVVDHLLGAGADMNFTRLERDAVLALEFLDDRRLQGRRAVGSRISGFAAFDRGRCLGADIGRGVKVGLADAEIDDVTTFLAHPARLLGDRHGRRNLETRHPRRDTDACGCRLAVVGIER